MSTYNFNDKEKEAILEAVHFFCVSTVQTSSGFILEIGKLATHSLEYKFDDISQSIEIEADDFKIVKEER